ncbi:hypothetical protein LTS18_013281 [Coniosporium uncinatum]|uniref:Uncharacterized protein n=1 Tax=Coniosporium uncinatum TaxID=93489 RepID=A0ACC3D9F5_9PEZI|nr:hypothetical protein LTS18_013281 [Coniosporium uncinatum]
MSAPQEGRQSPDPENQPGAQQQDTPASNVNEQGQQPEEGTKDANAEQLKALESNPTHILQKSAEEKTSKTM